MKPLFGIVVWVTALGLLGWRAWERWGPVPERPVPASVEVRQWSVTTCGPAALATILNAYGRPWSREELERECRVTGAGCSMYDLREACRRRGLRAEGLQATHSHALLRIPRPYIAHLMAGHFVVVARVRDGKLEVFDPTSGAVQAWPPEELHRRGQGWTLAVVPR
jgi:ABC-type bacteriocin/lantibiotic exporter with double-glycine peptidase domain